MSFFTQICLALKHCHDRNMLHRDLKPNNIFLTQRGFVKLADFGIARALGGTQEKARSIVGTPLYLSPEIFQSQPYDAKTDVWSLGVLLYLMAALEEPWKSGDLFSLGYKICKYKYSPLPQTYSVTLRNIVQMCLRKDPNQRPTVNELLKLPQIKSRIKNYLQADVFKQEFSNSLMLNEEGREEFQKRLSEQ